MTEHRVLLLTDVVDSTKLAERLGDGAMAEVWAAHDRAARDLLLRWQGREIDKSDGMLLLFGRVCDAVGYALDYHRALRAMSVPLQARAGIHVGPVVLRGNSADDVGRGAKPLEVEGIAKPVAARIMGLALGGQTLLSSAARQALGESALRVHSHGHWRMKGLAEPVELFEVGDDSSPWQPPPDSAKVLRVVQEGDLWKSLAEVRHNLPRERDPFVGRGSELAALARLLDDGSALVTLLGTGGSGKTRLARRFGWSWLGDFPGGVWFCDLSVARSLEGLVSAVAAALDVALAQGDPVAQLGHAIAGRGRCLLILDNFEQAIELAAATVGQWVDRAQHAAFLVTSREPLHLPGEQVFAVEPLAREPAMALFEARARAHEARFALDERNRDDVAAIVETLDGIPLAIELAAVRIRALGPKGLRERLRDRFRLLAGVRGPTERQATLAAAIDWSWDLLAPWEQAALAQCSAFEGGFTLGAAEAVLDLAAFPAAPPALDVVQALVDKSLVRAQAGRREIDEPYFGMYVSIHEYAAHKLRMPGAFAGSGPEGERSTWRRHGSHYAAFGTEDALEALDRHGGVDKRRRLALGLDNLVAACRRAMAGGDGDVVAKTLGAAWAVFDLQGPFVLAHALARQALDCEGLTTSPQAKARVLSCLASAAWRTGRFGEAQAQMAQALEIHRACGHRHAEGVLLGSLGVLHLEQGRLAPAQALFEQALGMHREAGSRRDEGVVLGQLGIVSSHQGLSDQARERYEQALAIHREVGNRRFEGFDLANLAIHHYQQGRIDLALAQFEQALAIDREVGNRRAEGVVLGNLGILCMERGRLGAARAQLERALALHRETGHRRAEGAVLGDLGKLARLEGRMQKAREQHEQALAIHREVGNRGFEGVALASLALLNANEGRIEEAFAMYGQAIAVHRQVGDLGSEGAVFGSLGDLHARLGQLSEARAAFDEGEHRLRQAGDKLELGKLLCARGAMEASFLDKTAARVALDEARAIAEDMATGPESELGRAVAALGERLAAAASVARPATDRPA